MHLVAPTGCSHLRNRIAELESELSAIEVGLDAASRSVDKVKDRVLQLDAKYDKLGEELHVWQPGQHQAPLEMPGDHRRCQVAAKPCRSSKSMLRSRRSQWAQEHHGKQKAGSGKYHSAKGLVEAQSASLVTRKKLVRQSKGDNSVDRWGGYDTV